jgi:hypothetical protein
MEQCKKKYGGVKDIEKTIKDIESFCQNLKSNKVKNSKEIFSQLPKMVQCLLLHHAWEILAHKNKHSEESYLTAFYMFKLFRGKDMKTQEVYSRYDKMTTLEKFYKAAAKWSKKTPVNTGRKKSNYDKEKQRYQQPEGDLDPLFIFYTSLYRQDPESNLAITWLTEHGVFEDEKRTELVKKYKKLEEKNRLIK